MAYPIDPQHKSRVVAYCVCSDCWGSLHFNPDSTVSCRTPNCETRGIIGRRAAEDMEIRSQHELASSIAAFQDAARSDLAGIILPPNVPIPFPIGLEAKRLKAVVEFGCTYETAVKLGYML